MKFIKSLVWIICYEGDETSDTSDKDEGNEDKGKFTKEQQEQINDLNLS